MKYFRTVFATCAIASALGTPVQAQMMGGHKPPVPMSVKEFRGARTGQNVQIAVRVDRLTRTTLLAELLEHRTDTVSKATGKHVTLYLPDGLPIVMGTKADIVPGAVLFVYGVVTKPGQVDVKRAVVDTQYVKVE